MSKPKVFKTYEKMDQALIEQLKLAYPFGFDKKLILIPGGQGKLISVLPFETEEKHYLIKMTREEAYKIIVDDDDYNADGNLKKSALQAYRIKHDDDYDDDEDDFDALDDLEDAEESED